MKLCVFIFLITTALNLQKIFSQELEIGQQVSYYNIPNVLNHHGNTINLADYKGKFVILDFWGFYCAPCLASFPKIDSIQRVFGNNLQIILVNTEEQQKTKEFFLHRSRLKIPIKVPLVTADTILNKFFPHDGVPFYVWIDTTGKICYKSTRITDTIISEFIKGSKLRLREGAQRKYVSSLFSEEFLAKIRYATYISAGIDSINLHIDYANDNVPYDCRSIQDLYQFAYNESDNDAFYKFREHGRTILKVKDVYKYRYVPGTDYDEWREKYGYYYHSILPDSLKKNKYKIMQKDLRRYFGMDVQIEKRYVKCLVLVRTSAKDKLKSKGGSPQQTSFAVDPRSRDDDQASPSIRFIRNKSFHSFFEVLRGYGDWYFGIKIIDGTGYIGKIDFEIKEDHLQNISVVSLRKELKRYDLDLAEKYIPLDVLIISEKK